MSSHRATGPPWHRNMKRPNRLGYAYPRLLAVDGLGLQVQDPDAINGTPVIDIAPWFAEFGPQGEVHQPTGPSLPRSGRLRDMSLRFEHMSINAADVPDGLFRFWAGALERPRGDGVVRPDEYGHRIGQNRPPYPVFTPTPGSSVEAETARMVTLGAAILGKYHNGWGCGWVELADPSGTMFAIGSAEPEDIEALLSTPREVDDPFWADAENQWSAGHRVPMTYAMSEAGPGIATTGTGWAGYRSAEAPAAPADWGHA
jgi:hypothetical protein